MSDQIHAGIVDGQHVIIYASNGFGIAEMIGPRMEKKKADANMLVEAVNNLTRVTAERDKLRAAVEMVLGRIDQLQEQWGKEGFTERTADQLREALKR